MTWKNILAATCMAAMLCIGFGMPAVAQEPGGGFPFPAEEQADPSPVNPAQKLLESGKVMVVVGSPRHFGYRIGEVIPVTVVISADQGVNVNTEMLKRNVLAAEGSDFETVDAPLIIKEEQNGKTIYRIHLRLRSWVIKPTLVLNVEFYYATDLLPDGVTPNWKPASTPDFVVTTSNTASDSSKELLEGDMETKTSPVPWVVKPLRYGGLLLLSALPAWLLWCVWRRARPVRLWSPEEKAWLAFDRVLASSSLVGLTTEHLKSISQTLRQYLQIEAVATENARVPLTAFFEGEAEQLEMLSLSISLLTKLDRAVYSKQGLSEDENRLLLAELERLIPRP